MRAEPLKAPSLIIAILLGLALILGSLADVEFIIAGNDVFISVNFCACKDVAIYNRCLTARARGLARGELVALSEKAGHCERVNNYTHVEKRKREE